MKKDQNITWRRTDLPLEISGKRVAIVGGTGGIGRALSKHLAARGAHVTVVGRTFRDAGNPNIDFVRADLELMTEAQRVGEQLPAEDLDLVVFTTGIMAARERQETAEGIERDMAVSYLSRLVLLRTLAPRLGTARAAGSPRPRVFVYGFPGSGQTAHVEDLNFERSYASMKAHMTTVAGNEALVLDAASRYPDLAVFGLNPGFVKSNIRGNMMGEGTLKHRVMETVVGWFTPSADVYASRIAPLLVTPDIDRHSGAMFDRKGQAIRPSATVTAPHVAQVVTASEQLLRDRVPALRL